MVNLSTSSTEETINKIVTDLYFGDGKENPPMTVRLDRLEQIVKNLSWLSGITLAAVVGELVKAWMK